MLNHILDQRLDRERRHPNIVERCRDGDFEADAVTEPGSLYFEIVADDFEFLA